MPLRTVRRACLALATLGVVACAGPAPAAPTAQAPAKAAPAAAPAAAASPAAPAAPPELKKISLVMPNSSFYMVPVLLAKEKGYFRDEGLDLDITMTGAGSKAVAAVVGSSADIGAMEFSDTLAAVAKKQPIQGFAAFCTEPTVSVVMKKSAADQRGLTDQSPLDDKLKALKGLKIAITAPGSGTDSSLRWALLKVGLDPDKDVEIVSSGSAQNELAAFAQGQVDALSQVSPWVELAVAKNDGFLVVSFPRGDVPEQKGRLSFALAALRDSMDKNPELYTSATRAVWRGLKFVAEQPDEAKKLAKETMFAEVDPPIYDLAWKINLPSYPRDPRFTEQHVQLNVDFKARVTGEKLDIPFDQAVTNRFVDAAANTMR
jgi:NitT/TauT family transport system substrate-binding protein